MRSQGVGVVAVSACLVTRGDIDMTPILDSLPFDDVIVYDNSKRENLAVYGRYAAIAEAKHDTIYVQDDDCTVNVAALLAEHEPGERLCNMPAWKQNEYPFSSLVGWGALFPRTDADIAFAGWERDDAFYRCCDCVFTARLPFRRIDVGHTDLPYATDASRMYQQPNHYRERARVTDLALQKVAA